MAGEVNDIDRSAWVWVPNVSYGPFVFGSKLEHVPYIGPELERREVDGDGSRVVYFSSLTREIELTFWSGLLTSVDFFDEFTLLEFNWIGSELKSITSLVACDFKYEESRSLIVAMCDNLNLLIFAYPDGIVSSVSVGIDPDALFS